jgi:iron complex outermembrane recepter protein
VLPTGVNPPRSTNITIDETTILKDRRTFFGAYGQAIVRPIERLTLLGGARLNRTSERRCGAVANGTILPAPSNCDRLNKTRISGSVGATLDVIKSEKADLALYVSYRNTYKPAAIDFGPEGEEGILKPETSNSIEAGFKSGFFDDRITIEANYFNTKFRNLVIRENVGGLPALANAGKEKFEGVDLDVRILPVKDVNIGLSYAYHLAKFTDFARLRPNGSIQQLAGNRLELSPKYVGSAVFSYAPKTGINFSGSVHYTGNRFLNKGNTAIAKRYATIDARLGYRLNNGFGLFIDGDNLTNRRDPVAESEIGDAQFYRLPGRRLLLTAQLNL